MTQHTHTCMECMGIGMRAKGQQPRGHATLFLLCMQTHGGVDRKAVIICHSKPPRRETNRRSFQRVWTLRYRPPVSPSVNV